MKILIRPKYKKFDEARFDALIEKLEDTLYKTGADYKEAPKYTDCVTAIRYILENSSEIVLPRVYI
jgi:hypothetical protein